MAAFSDTCDSKVSRTARLRGMYMKSKSNVCGSPQEQSDCSTVLEKSQEFFQICDTEDKGFVTRRDMQVRLQHAQEKMCCILNNCISNSKYRILYATTQYLIGIVQLDDQNTSITTIWIESCEMSVSCVRFNQGWAM